MAVSRLELEDGQVTAASEQEGGQLVASGRLPLLIGVDKGINEPRYPGMKSIMVFTASRARPWPGRG